MRLRLFIREGGMRRDRQILVFVGIKSSVVAKSQPPVAAVESGITSLRRTGSETQDLLDD